MDGLWWKTLLKWMIWGYPYFRKHPYVSLDHLKTPGTPIHHQTSHSGHQSWNTSHRTIPPKNQFSGQGFWISKLINPKSQKRHRTFPHMMMKASCRKLLSSFLRLNDWMILWYVAKFSSMTETPLKTPHIETDVAFCLHGNRFMSLSGRMCIYPSIHPSNQPNSPLLLKQNPYDNMSAPTSRTAYPI